MKYVRRRPLTDRELQVLALRDQKRLTFEAIAGHLGVSVTRARGIYKISRATQEYQRQGTKGDVFFGLSARAASLLKAAGYTSCERVIAGIKAGELRRQMGWQKLFGRKA